MPDDYRARNPHRLGARPDSVTWHVTFQEVSSSMDQTRLFCRGVLADLQQLVFSG